MNIKSFHLSGALSFIVLAVLFFALTVINNTVLQGIRFDLTENKLYTLSEGTVNILKNIKAPLTLYLFFSEDATNNYPHLKNYHGRVRDMLEEYRQHADGKLKVQYLDPEPFSEVEDQAAQLGLQNVKLADGNSLYFGLAATNVLDNVEVIPFFQQNKEIFLEHEISKLIYSLSRLKKPRIGLMTSLDMYPTRLDSATGQMNKPWLITEQLEQLFDVQLVHSDAEKIDDSIEVLMIVHPKYLEEKAFYAIDQFIMRGGKGLFFVDPYSSVESVPTAADSPMPDKHAKSSSLNRLFEAWGFAVNEDSVVADPRRSMPVSIGNGETVKHLAVLSMQEKNFDQGDIVMEGLQKINIAFASYVELLEDAENSEIELLPLIQTTDQAGLLPLDLLRFMPHPDLLRQRFESAGKSYPIAARIQGKLKSSFDKPPAVETEGDEGDEGDEQAQETLTNAEHLTETAETANLVVVADTDILTDQLWAQTRMFFGQRVVQPFASNRDFAINLVDNLFGNSDLIGIRSRATFSRPFTKVQEIEDLADRRYRTTEEGLNQEYSKANEKLKALQEKRPDKENILMTPEQKNEIQTVKRKMLEVRKKLRNVRHQQVQDIEKLGAYLKIINIGVVPSIVILIALVAFVLKIRKRRRSVSV